MLKKMKLFTLYLFFVFFNLNNLVLAQIVKNIEVKGNERISSETILMFSDVLINDDVDSQKINKILKNLYDSNFFENISINIIDNNLLINVVELPIIQNVLFDAQVLSEHAEKTEKVSVDKVLYPQELV